MEVIPGILEKDWRGTEEKLNILKSFAKSAHIDIIDGRFAGNTTLLNFEGFTPYASDLFLEAHLMVEEPINYLDALSRAGFKRFIGHVEKMSNQEEFVAKGRLLGEVGLALDGPSPLDLIAVDWTRMDVVLVFTAQQVGFSGLQLLPGRLEKARQIKTRANIPIEVDGGINDKTILPAMASGADRFVATSFIYEGNEAERYKILTSKLHGKGGGEND